MKWGKWIVAVVPVALVVGCGGSSGPGSVKGDEGVIRSQQATTAPAPSPTAETKADWLASGGQDILDAISGDLTQLAAAGGNADSQGVETAAISLKADIDRGQQFHPIPNAAAQTEWTAALADGGTAATDYITGAENMDAGLITAGTSALEQGTAHLKVMNELLGT